MFVIIAEHFDSLDLIRTRRPNSCAQNGMPALLYALRLHLRLQQPRKSAKIKKAQKFKKKKASFLFMILLELVRLLGCERKGIAMNIRGPELNMKLPPCSILERPQNIFRGIRNSLWNPKSACIHSSSESPPPPRTLTALGEASTLFQAKCRYVRDTACPALRPQHVAVSR